VRKRNTQTFYYPKNGTPVNRRSFDKQIRDIIDSLNLINLGNVPGVVKRTAVNHKCQTNEYFIGFTDLSVSRTGELPQIKNVSLGKKYVFKDVNGGVGATMISILTPDSATIDGQNTYTIRFKYGSVTIIKTDDNIWSVESEYRIGE